MTSAHEFVCERQKVWLEVSCRCDYALGFMVVIQVRKEFDVSIELMHIIATKRQVKKI